MKRIARIIVMGMILILTGTISYASTSINTTLNSTSQDLYAKDEVVFTVRLDDLKEINHGINAYKATLVYEHDIFEKVKGIDFKSLNGWEGLQYNSETGEFVIYKKAGTTVGEDIVQISLKVKEGAKAAKTKVELVDVVASEGKKDIFSENTEKGKIDIDIIEEQKKPEEEIPSDKPSIDNTESDASNSQTNGNKKPSFSGTLPKTGYNFILLFVLLGVEIVVVVYAVHFGDKYVKNRKNKMYIVAILISALVMQFIGTVYGAASTFSKKGELNGDGAVDYADVSLLVAHLANIKYLDEGKSDATLLK